MFLSLKGALGRNPMINRVGQRLLQAFEGASAAYSLRDLASNIASVVRVRRASDNTEKDFSAADVSSGAMTEWVNAQVVPPLDVRELVDGERTGALIPAAAAYSLRNLSASYTGNVVDVRRSSDNAEESFTAAEVADGTLVDWVTEEQVGWNTRPFWDVSSGDGVISSQSSTATTSTFSITTTSGASFVRQSSKPNHIIASSGDQVVANITMSGFDSAVTGLLRTSGTNTNVSSKTLNNGTADYTFYLTGPAGYLTFSGVEATSGATLTINSVKVIGKSGFVSQWYDQSGNDNHATQGTDASQPKIVDGGSLITRGVTSEPSILFGGAADDQLDVVGRPIAKSVFSALQASNTNFETLICDATDDSPRVTTNNNANNRAYSFAGFGTPSVNVDGVTYDGTSNVSSLGFHLLGMTSGSGSSINRIGANPSTGATGNSFDYVSELIIYNSDQSDNRTAFEANIGETYGIDLPSGVDTGYDQVDGFVETWYDQSGNGSDATQSVAGSQPKIVDAGVLVLSNGKPAINPDGVDDHLESSLVPPSTASLFVLSDAPSLGLVRFSYGARDSLDERSYVGQKLSGDVAGGVASQIISGGQFTEKSILSLIYNGSTKSMHVNGVSLGTSVQTQTVDNVTQGYSVFAMNDQGTNAFFFDAPMQEIIVYNSDQSANRAGIEANINNQYDIY